jgi:hypothetical protein
MLVNAAVEYPEADEDEASNEALLHEPESNSRALARAPPSHKAVPFCPLPGEVRYLKWWLTNFLGIIWIFSTSMQKWAMMSAQKRSSNSKIRQISLYL